MTDTSLSTIYREYIDCLNRQDWAELEQFVHDEVHYNGEPIGLSGYREMLERDFREIPDLHFDIHLLICEPPHVASRLRFDCTPKGSFLGLEVNGRKVSFAENVSTSSTSGKSKRHGPKSIRLLSKRSFSDEGWQRFYTWSIRYCLGTEIRSNCRLMIQT